MTPTFKLQPSETPARTTQFIAELPLSRANRERRWLLRNMERGPIMICMGRRGYMVLMPYWMYTLYAEAAKKMAGLDPEWAPLRDPEPHALQRAAVDSVNADWDRRLAPLRELGANDRLRAAARDAIDLGGEVRAGVETPRE
jgi:hypothetical protein